ncbi:hypothetical protein HDF17_001926 [Granulicella arctica]|uniref:Uncharacterized protein n=1 Tax=Granulicella arctica TaxID=940613 RepID=A0A7Y9PGT8_9BACT|nr:hypothetical protein [Granulicella arctica]
MIARSHIHFSKFINAENDLEVLILKSYMPA